MATQRQKLIERMSETQLRLYEDGRCRYCVLLCQAADSFMIFCPQHHRYNTMRAATFVRIGPDEWRKQPLDDLNNMVDATLTEDTLIGKFRDYYMPAITEALSLGLVAKTKIDEQLKGRR